MKSNVYTLPVRPLPKPAAPAPKRERIVYLPDCLERRETRLRFPVTWERDPSIPRWLDALCNWVELLSTVGMTVWAGYWLWYAMWVLR